MNDLHRQWARTSQAAAPHVHQHYDTSHVPTGSCCHVPGQVEDANPTTRHWPRTTDEAFRTPAWRDPVSGPFERPGPIRGALELLAAALLALALVGVFL
jgi:hypothetical protein